jgi:hypothetical protein
MKKINYTKISALCFAFILGLTNIAIAQEFYVVHPQGANAVLLDGEQIDSVKVVSGDIQFYDANNAVYTNAVANIDSVRIVTVPTVSNTATTFIEAMTYNEGIPYKANEVNQWVTWYPGYGSGNHACIELWASQGSWVAYYVNVVDAGTYDFTFAAIPWNPGTLTLSVDGAEVGSTPYTAPGLAAVLLNISNISLSAGPHTLKIQASGSGSTLVDAFSITANNGAPTLTNSAPLFIAAIDNLEGRPAAPNEWIGWVPGYGTGATGADHQNINVGWDIASVSYAINVADAGNYDFKFALASWAAGTLTLSVDDVELGSTPYTQVGIAAALFEISNIALTTGSHILKLGFTGNTEFDAFSISASADVVPTLTNSAPLFIASVDNLEGRPAAPNQWIGWVSGYGTADHQSISVGWDIASVSYSLEVADAGNYDFKFALATWAAGTLTLSVDDVELGSTPYEQVGIAAKLFEISNIALTTGSHILKLGFSAHTEFDGFSISAHP